MKKIELELSEEQFARLKQAAERRYESLAELLKTRLVDIVEDPIDLLAPRAQRWGGERDEEFRRRIA